MHQTKLTRSSAPRIDVLRFVRRGRDRYRASRSTRVGRPAEVMRLPDPSRPLPLLLGSCHAKANANVNVRADVTIHVRLALDASEPQSLDTLEPLFAYSILSPSHPIPSLYTNRNTPSIPHDSLPLATPTNRPNHERPQPEKSPLTSLYPPLHPHPIHKPSSAPRSQHPSTPPPAAPHRTYSSPDRPTHSFARVVWRV